MHAYRIIIDNEYFVRRVLWRVATTNWVSVPYATIDLALAKIRSLEREEKQQQHALHTRLPQLKAQ